MAVSREMRREAEMNSSGRAVVFNRSAHQLIEDQNAGLA
jgi:hypothetical protein